MSARLRDMLAMAARLAWLAADLGVFVAILYGGAALYTLT